MKVHKLNLFALIGSLLMLFACSKEAEVSEIAEAPISAEIWLIQTETFTTNGEKMNVTGTLVLETDRFARHMYFSNGQPGHHDTIPCRFSGDSIYFRLYNTDMAGVHYVSGDTLYSAIPPNKFYR